MAGDLNDPELEDFLCRVNELESIVKSDAVPDKQTEGSLSSAGSSDGVRRQKEPVDRTVINRAAFKDASTSQRSVGPSQSQTPDDFMKALEADANQRAEKRRKQKAEATVLKDQGNQEFQTGNYTRAVELYTEGLDRLKDFVILYTNRAQAYIKLEKFPEAIEDCQTALQLEPENVKALVHLGRAQQGLEDYETAIKTFQEIRKIDQKHEKMVTDYIAAVNLAESTARSNMEAEKLFSEGDIRATGVHETVMKLNQSNHPIPYYAGGMRVLSFTLNDDASRAQFRSFGGFDLLTDHSVIQQSLDDAAAGKDRKSDVQDLLCSTFDLLSTAVKDNEENIVHLINVPTTPSLLVNILSSASSEIQSRCVCLLYTVSRNPRGCCALLQHINVFRLLTSLLTFLRDPRADSISPLAADVLGHLIQSDRFVARFSATVGEFQELNSAFENLLRNSKIQQSVLLESIRSMFTLTREKYVRNRMKTKGVIAAVVGTMERFSKKQSTPSMERILTDLISLLINVFAESCPSEGYQKELKSIFVMMMQLLESDNEELRQRAIGLLSRTLANTSESAVDVIKQNVIPKIVHVMKIDGDRCGQYASKCLAVLTQRSEIARKELVRVDKELKVICELLKGENSITIANAALIIGHCTQVPGLSGSLISTDIIKTLLSKTDTTSEAVKENCAIALAKLATTDDRHLERLRELGGIGILHSCMKYVKQ
ncbi:tetratricopeptide repeat protein 12-like isoform X2 [Acanthaster planci]|uniref:Tetratricopeptide repeat protein 12-like isoform X2 n=1 Tax=Acanthaster planci TaxID=133434 RepID=A0A8B7Z0P5_ACAPL|nr:tetratricopeptide repeat protein 12-like isoform X2 [Acanthaster planci]